MSKLLVNLASIAAIADVGGGRVVILGDVTQASDIPMKPKTSPFTAKASGAYPIGCVRLLANRKTRKSLTRNEVTGEGKLMIPIIPEPFAYLIFLHLMLWIAQGYYNHNWNPLKMYKRPKKEED